MNCVATEMTEQQRAEALRLQILLMLAPAYDDRAPGVELVIRPSCAGLLIGISP